MQVSEAKECFIEYHRMNSKKKHGEELWTDLFQIWWTIRWKRCRVYHPGDSPGVSHRFHRRKQTVNQKAPLFPPFSILQFHQKLVRSGISKSLRHSNFEKDIQRTKVFPLGYLGKRCCWWNHFQDSESQEPHYAGTNGPCWYEDRRGLENNTG